MAIYRAIAVRDKINTSRENSSTGCQHIPSLTSITTIARDRTNYFVPPAELLQLGVLAFHPWISRTSPPTRGYLVTFNPASVHLSRLLEHRFMDLRDALPSLISKPRAKSRRDSGSTGGATGIKWNATGNKKERRKMWKAEEAGRKRRG